MYMCGLRRISVLRNLFSKFLIIFGEKDHLKIWENHFEWKPKIFITNMSQVPHNLSLTDEFELYMSNNQDMNHA